MSSPFISFLVTCKDEGLQLRTLINLLYKHIEGNEIIVLDDYSTETETLKLRAEIENSNYVNVFWHTHALSNNYSAHKNYGKLKCIGKYIFQIDADELPSEILLESIKDIVILNEDIELFWVPRINDFIGVSQTDALKWGWWLTPYKDRQIVNWPDPQGRLFKNLPNVRWERRLHEKIEGVKSYSYLPYDYDLALHHNKTIEKQIETNLKYNTQFTSEENRGFKLS